MLTNSTSSVRSETPRRALLAAAFEHNLDAAGLRGLTRELVSSAEPRGQVVHLGDGTPVLRLDGQLLGTPSTELGAPGNDEVIVVFGLGLGHTVRALRALASSTVIVYEPSPGIVRTAFERGPTDLGDVEIVCTLHDLTQIWAPTTRGRVAVTLIRTPGYSQTFPGEERELTEALTRLVSRAGVNANTYRARARVWIQDVLDNLDCLCEAPLFQALAGQYANVPAFIVGAGPSLGKNGELLAAARKKGIVFAVNSSGRALASYGVEPQVLACMESIDVSHLIADLPYIDRVVRAFSLTASPKTFKTGKGPLLPIYEALPEVAGALEGLTGHTGLSVCASISTVAFSLAQRLGCSPIVLVGQDLAYTGGRAYARGTVYESSTVSIGSKGELELNWSETLKSTHERGGSSMRSREPLDEVPAWGGRGSVWSGPGFMPVRLWFEEAARLLKKARPELELVNATEGGARIPAFEERTLAEVLAPLPELDITSASIAEAAQRARGEVAPERLRAWLAEQTKLTQAIARVAARTRRLAERAERAIESGNPRRVRKTFGALDRSEAELRAAVHRSRIVEAWCFAELDAIKIHDDDEALDPSDEMLARRAIRREMSIAKIIEESAHELEGALALVSQRLGENKQRNQQCRS